MSSKRAYGLSTVFSLLLTVGLSTFAFGQQFHVLHTFQCAADGSTPFSGVVRGKDGNLYGTTLSAGTGASPQGTVFKITTSGQFTSIHTFNGGTTDGRFPTASVIQDTAGNLYGITPNGGPSDAGVVYKIDKSGHETVLYSFTGFADGGYSESDLIRDVKGNLYGTTLGGGDISCSSYLNGCGTVFKLDALGKETLIHTLEGGDDGEYPYPGVVMDSTGNLYGATTLDDGVNFVGGGQAFEIDKSGNKTVLHKFVLGSSDGDSPTSDLAFGPGHVLYGTTSEGGDMTGCLGSGCGVVFRIDATNVYSVFHTFHGAPTSGGNPTGPTARDTAGNLYGVTYRGGANDLGAVYKLDVSGNETLLHSFTGLSDGFAPSGRLYVDGHGNVYGTARQGGFGCGVIYKITP